MTERVFPIIPAGNGVSWVAGGILLLLLVLCGLMVFLVYSARHVQFTVSAEGLRISGDLYGRLVPPGKLKTEAARVVDLRLDDALQLSLRTNGAAFPGYSSGWYRLKNGEKALCFLTDRSRVVYVPTTDGYSVLMSTADPAALLAAVREVAPR